MNKQKIFPDSVINQSYEQIIAEYGKRTHALYLIILFAIVAVFVSLFFIYIDVGVTTTGMIKTRGERNIITAPASGKLHFIKLKENVAVSKGDTLFIVVSENITSQMPALNQRKTELLAMLEDLNAMLSSGNLNNLKSPTYNRAVAYYTTQLDELKHKQQVLQTAHDREKKLFDKGITTAADYEQYKAEYENAVLAVNTFLRGQRAQWQADRISYQNELRDIETKLTQIEIQNSETVVRAPVDGTIQTIQSVSDGSYVYSGQQLVEISPDGALLAECYVTSGDIGFLKTGMPCRMQIDAFNYNQWGMIDGTLTDIANDITVTENGSYYKVFCTMNKNFLQLKNGYRGYIKKGMIVGARFIVNRRSLFQILYDKVDDWLNPNQMKKEK